VVDGPVPAYAIVAGNPGLVVGMRFDEETIRRLRKVAWWDWDEPTLERFMPVLASGEVHRFLASVEAGGLV
jgi:virginiamycin A acetyltransferase